MLTLIQLRAGVGFLQMVLDYRYLESFIHCIKLSVDATHCCKFASKSKELGISLHPPLRLILHEGWNVNIWSSVCTGVDKQKIAVEYSSLTIWMESSQF